MIKLNYSNFLLKSNAIFKLKSLNNFLHSVFFFNKLSILAIYQGVLCSNWFNLKTNNIYCFTILNQFFCFFYFNVYMRLFLNVNNFNNVKVVHLISASFLESFEFFVNLCLNFKYLNLSVLLVFNIFCRFTNLFFTSFNNMYVYILKSFNILYNLKNVIFFLNKNKCLWLGCTLYKIFLYKFFFNYLKKNKTFMYLYISFIYKLNFIYKSIYKRNLIYTHSNIKNFINRLKVSNFFFKYKYIYLKKSILSSYLAVILSQKGRNMFVSVNTVKSSGGFRCIFKLSCGMSKLGKRKKQRNSKHSIKILGGILVNFLSTITQINQRFSKLMIILKGKPRLWRFKWIIRVLKKVRKYLKIRVFLDRTDKIYGLVRRAKLRRM